MLQEAKQENGNGSMGGFDIGLFIRYGNKDNPTGTFYNSYKPQGDVLSEGVGLGHLEPFWCVLRSIKC